MSRRADRKRVVILAIDVETVLEGLPERTGMEAARARMLVRRMLAGLRGSVQLSGAYAADVAWAESALRAHGPMAVRHASR